MYYFCTYFDKNYLIRALALYKSLEEHCPEFCLWGLCLDEESYDALSRMDLPKMKLIVLEDFEDKDYALQEAKKNRSRVEYYFTCTPSLLLFILNNFSYVDLVTYIDADLYFFSDPGSIFEEISDYSIAIIEHRFSPQNRENTVSGIYNVGWVSFRRDGNSFACLNHWRDFCNEWCYDYIEGDRFADQKYLDDWPMRFNNVVVLQHIGANAAPWNIGNYKISVDNNRVSIDEQVLVFFHFHGCRHLIWRIYHTGLGYYKTKVNKTIRQFIYEPYLKRLLTVSWDLRGQFGGFFSLPNIRIRRDISLLRRIYYVIFFNDYVMV